MFKLIIFYLLCLVSTIQPAEVSLGRKECLYGTEEGISYADCSRLFLTDFPKGLTTSIKGLYLSWNYIEILYNSTFERYSSIQFLYLDRNPTIELESHTFAPLNKLHTLDLSYNPALNISNLFLPTSLIKLYLSGIKTFANHVPISSLRELNYLTLSECKLSQFPSFGGNLPSLEALNLTANKLENFKLDDNLAFLCQLKKLYTSHHVSIKSNCECLRLRKWLDDQSITGSNVICNGTKNHEDCNLSPSDSFLKFYDSCKTDVITKKFIHWFLIGCGVFITCFLCVMLYVCNNTKGLFCNVICCRCCRKKY